MHRVQSLRKKGDTPISRIHSQI